MNEEPRERQEHEVERDDVLLSQPVVSMWDLAEAIQALREEVQVLRSELRELRWKLESRQ